MRKLKTASYEIKITEKEFESQVRDLARLFGWKYYHTWRSIHSEAGYPDCCMVKSSRLIFAELKTEKGGVSPHQQEWIDLLQECGGNVECYVWRPSDIESIAGILNTTF